MRKALRKALLKIFSASFSRVVENERPVFTLAFFLGEVFLLLLMIFRLLIRH